MSKRTRKEKREEEKRIIEEMEAGMKEQGLSMPASSTYSGGNKKKKHVNGYDETMPEKIHCKHCKTLMENGVCPNCGHTVYVPMDKKQREKTRLIVAIVCMVVFVIVFVAMQFANA